MHFNQPHLNLGRTFRPKQPIGNHQPAATWPSPTNSQPPRPSPTVPRPSRPPRANSRQEPVSSESDYDSYEGSGPIDTQTPSSLSYAVSEFVELDYELESNYDKSLSEETNDDGSVYYEEENDADNRDPVRVVDDTSGHTSTETHISANTDPTNSFDGSTEDLAEDSSGVGPRDREPTNSRKPGHKDMVFPAEQTKAGRSTRDGERV